MLYFTHLAPSKCVQNNTVYRGDTPLFSPIKVHLVSPCILAKSQLQSQQNYHEVGSLLKSFLLELSLEIVSVVAYIIAQYNIMVSVPFICR